MKAVGNRYIATLVEAGSELTSNGGILLKTTGDTQLVEIIDIGPDVKNPIPAGTKIAINFNHAVLITFKSKQYFSIEESHVLGVAE